MMPLEDQLDDLEHRLENARRAGNQNAIHTLTQERNHTIHQISATRRPHH